MPSVTGPRIPWVRGPFHPRMAAIEHPARTPTLVGPLSASEGKRVSARNRFHARYTKHDEPAVLVNVPTLFTLDEAAEALARVYRERARRLTGQNAIQQGLNEAAADRVLETDQPASGELVAHYRRALIDAGVFEE